jgi:hypothetical protein
MADDGEGEEFDWAAFLISEDYPTSLLPPFVEAGNEVGNEGMLNPSVVEGMEKNYVEEEIMGKKGAESVVGAAGSDSQGSPSGLREHGPASNGNYGGFEFNADWDWESLAAHVGKETAGGGSTDDSSVFTFHTVESVVEAVAPQAHGMVNLGNKRGADRMGGLPPEASGSKRQRSSSGSTETSGGSNVNDEATGSEASDLLAALANAHRKESVWLAGYTDAEFKRHFHMSRSTFFTLCGMLDPYVRKGDTASRDAIPVPKRVAVCLYRFATGDKFRGIERRFGIAICTIHKIIHSVTAAINSIVEPEWLSARWPRGADAMAAAAAKFQDLTGGLPGVIGAVYTTHVQFQAPANAAASEYFSRRLTQRSDGKTSYSVALHAAVDADGAFTDLIIDNPGAISDEQIFCVMSTTHAAEMVAQGKRLVGGEGYPLTDWTLVPYTDRNDLTQPENNFNEKVALARGVALDAFRRLKARWALLQKRGAGNMDDFKSMMRACCVLHNFCERNGDVLGDELNGFNLEDEEMVLENPVRSATAVVVRDAIADNLLHGSTVAAPTTIYK